MKMRIITDTEWDRLAELTAGNNDLMHWKDMSSWVDDKENQYHLVALLCLIRGYYSAYFWSGNYATYRRVDTGFRPTVDDLPLPSNGKDGQIVTVGTLYMDGKPVHVPQNPTEKGDIMDYIPGAKLEMREPLKDPAYQVTGIRDGNKVYVDRALLKNISYEDIEKALPKAEPTKDGAFPCNPGDTVYIIEQDAITTDVVVSLVLQKDTIELNFFNHKSMDQSDLGKTVFLTQAEAEQVLYADAPMWMMSRLVHCDMGITTEQKFYSTKDAAQKAMQVDFEEIQAAWEEAEGFPFPTQTSQEDRDNYTNHKDTSIVVCFEDGCSFYWKVSPCILEPDNTTEEA